jgi:hypothetical protein
MGDGVGVEVAVDDGGAGGQGGQIGVDQGVADRSVTGGGRTDDKNVAHEKGSLMVWLDEA